MEWGVEADVPKTPSVGRFFPAVPVRGCKKKGEISSTNCCNQLESRDVYCWPSDYLQSCCRLRSEATSCRWGHPSELLLMYSTLRKCLWNFLHDYYCTTILRHWNLNIDSYQAPKIVRARLFVWAAIRVPKSFLLCLNTQRRGRVLVRSIIPGANIVHCKWCASETLSMVSLFRVVHLIWMKQLTFPVVETQGHHVLPRFVV